jgi:hypothetical protein
MASGTYLLNDLADVTNDRHHQRKRERPFAAGDLGLLAGWLTWPTLLALALALAGIWLPWGFTASLVVYFALTVTYSLRLKQKPIIDVLTLAVLYTLRNRRRRSRDWRATVILVTVLLNVPVSESGFHQALQRAASGTRNQPKQ